MLRILRPLLALALVVAAVGCGGDDASSDAGPDGTLGTPAVRIDIDDSGWSVATAGGRPETGEVPIELTNSREADVDIWVFPAPAGYEPGAPLPAGMQAVVEATLAGGQNIEVTATVAEPGRYAVLVDPPAGGSAQSIGPGFTVVDG